MSDEIRSDNPSGSSPLADTTGSATDQAYEAWLEMLAQECNCDDGPCAGCQQGAPCDCWPNAKLSDCRRKRKVERKRRIRIAAARGAERRGGSSSPASCSASEKCEGCGDEYSGKTAYTPDDVALCPDCAKENAPKCLMCGKPFVPTPLNRTACKKCLNSCREKDGRP